MNKLILSVDLDDYWCTHPNSQYSFLESSIENMVAYFEKYNIRATFFCVAKDEKILKKYIPELLKKGHEVANHSYSHQYNQLLTFDEKKIDIERSTEILSDIAQQKIRGYRAPGWGYDKDVGNMLNKLGYSYDASVAISPLFIPLRLFHSRKFKKKTYIYGTFRENLGFIQNSQITTIPLRAVCLLPFYGSFHLYAPYGMNFLKLQKNTIKDREVVNYIFHAFDFYINENDHSFQLTKKRNHKDNLERILSEIVKNRESTTYFDSLCSRKS